MSNVVRFYHIYNFVATQMSERLSRMHVTPEHTTIPIIVKNGKILSDDDLLIYHILYDTSQQYFAQDINLKKGEYFKHFISVNNIIIPDDMEDIDIIKRDYEDFIGNRFCLAIVNCYSNQDKEYEIYNPYKFYPREGD
jgi:hypothetical protein